TYFRIMPMINSVHVTASATETSRYRPRGVPRADGRRECVTSMGDVFPRRYCDLAYGHVYRLLRRVVLVTREASRPPDAIAQRREDRRHEHRPHEQGVQEHSDAHDQAKLRQCHQRQYAECREHAGKYDTRTGDHGTGRADRADHAATGAQLESL